MEGNFESCISVPFRFCDSKCDPVPTLGKRGAMHSSRGRLAASNRGCSAVNPLAGPPARPSAPSEELDLAGETQLTLVEFNKRLGGIRQVPHRLVLPTPSQEGI